MPSTTASPIGSGHSGGQLSGDVVWHRTANFLRRGCQGCALRRANAREAARYRRVVRVGAGVMREWGEWARGERYRLSQALMFEIGWI
jgi:hypothetical protein